MGGRRRPVVEAVFEKEIGNARSSWNYTGIRMRYLKEDGADDWRNPGGGILQKPLPTGFWSHVVANVGGRTAWIGRGRGIACGYTYRKRAYGEQNHKRPPALDPRPIRVCRVQHSLNVNGFHKHIRGYDCDQASPAVTNVIPLATSGWMDRVDLRLHKTKENHEFSGLQAFDCALPRFGPRSLV